MTQKICALLQKRPPVPVMDQAPKAKKPQKVVTDKPIKTTKRKPK